MTILLDTNVLVYALGGEHPLQAVAADLVGLAGELALRTTRGVLEEFAHACARRGRPRAEVHERVHDWFQVLGPVVEPEDGDVMVAFDLWEAHPRLDVFDATLAATALRLGAKVVSADRAYAEVAGLGFVELADPGLRERLGAN